LTDHSSSCLIEAKEQKHDQRDINWPFFPATLKFEHKELNMEEIKAVDSSSEGIRALMSDDFYTEIPYTYYY